MNRIYTKLHLYFLALSLLFIIPIGLKAQVITIGAVENGPYGKGSSIAVPITIDETTGCVAKTNTYQLYLSNAAGNFGPGSALIGTYLGFYTTFINGIIPAGTTPGNYKLQVRSTNPAISQTMPGTISVSAAETVTAEIQTTEIQPGVFGICEGRAETFVFTDNSTPGSDVTATIKDGLTSATTGTLDFDIAGAKSFVAQTKHYSVVARAEKGGVISTKGYFLINNEDKTAFSTIGPRTICVDGSITYGINSNELRQNFPGNTYQVNWGDGTIENYTICELAKKSNQVSHIYRTPSCGPSGILVEVKTIKPLCGSLSGIISTRAFVLDKPINSFTSPSGACATQVFIFTNTSNPGGTATAAADCKDPNAKYTWSVTDNTTGITTVEAVNVPLDFKLNYTFPRKGTYTITLKSTNESPCPVSAVSQTICIQDQPRPSFTIPQTLVCKNYTFKPTNTSVFDDPCFTPNLYNWQITGPAGGYSYTNGNAQSREPEFRLIKAGTFKIKLTIGTPSCGNFATAEQTIIVNELPVATLSPDQILCSIGTYDFNGALGITNATLSGTTTPEPNNTYTWSVVSANGGTHSYMGGTNANSKYPTIKFNDFDKYTITVVHNNNCGNATDFQVLDFRRSPVAIAGSYAAVCPGETIPLNGSVTYNGSPILPAGYTYQWTGGAGTFSPNRGALNAVYTPAAAEHGTNVQLTLQVNNPAPCNIVTSLTTITIKPRNTGTNATQSICSGSPVNFTPVSSLSGSTFNWTATGTATGFSATGSGNIADVLTNTSSADATVTYIITPVKNGCNGTPFTLTVTVKPLPVITLQPDFTLCNNQPAAINITSNLTGNSYTWTSTVLSGTLTGNRQQTIATTTSLINDVLVNSGSVPAKVRYSITPVSAGSCTGQAQSVVVTVQPDTRQADAGADAVVCNTSSYTLNGNAPGVYETGKWTVVSGISGNPFTDDTNPATEANGLTAGNTYTFKWTISGITGCDPTQDVVAITVRPDITTPNPGPDQVFCAFTSTNNSFLLNGNLDASRSYETVKWRIVESPTGSTSVFDNPDIPNATLQNIIPGTYKLLYIISNGGICTPRSEEFILTVPEIVIPGILSGEVTVCAGNNNGILSLTSSSGRIVEWQSAPSVSGPWTSISNIQTTFTFTDLTETTFYRVKVGSNEPSCTNSAYSNSIQVTVNSVSVGGVTAGGTAVCGPVNSGTITLSGQVGDVVRWEAFIGSNWITVSTINTVNYSYTNITQTTKYRAIVKNGVCNEISSSESIVTVNPIVPQASAGTDKIICNLGTYTLQGNDPAAFTGKWTVISGQAGVTFADDSKYNTSVSGLLPGEVYRFRWTISGEAPCTPEQDEVIITVRPDVTVASAGADAAVCDYTPSTNNSYNLSANLNAIRTYESGRWSIVTQPTGSNASFNNPASNNATIINLIPGDYLLEWKISNDIDCTPSTDQITIKVFPRPVAGILGAAVTVCEGSGGTLTLRDNEGTILRWESSSNGTGAWTAIAFTGNTYTFSNIVATTFYRAVVGSGGAPNCTTQVASNVVEVTVNLLSLGGTASGPLAVCAGQNTGTIALANYRGTIQRWELSVDGGTTWNTIQNLNPELNFSNLAQTTQYRAVVKNGICDAVNSTVATVTVNPQVVAATAGSDKVLCNETTFTLQGNDPAAFTGKWTVISGQAGVVFADDSKYNTSVSGLRPGEVYTFRWTISGTASCPETSDEVKVTVRPDVTVANAGANGAVCDYTSSTNNSYVLTANLDATRTYESGRWSIVAQPTGSNASFNNPASNNATILNLIPGDYLLEWKIFNDIDCTPSTDQIILKIFPKPVAGILGAAVTICEGGGGTLTLRDNVGTILRWESSSTGTGAWTAIPFTGNTYTFSNITATTFYRAVVGSDGTPNCTTEVASNVVEVTVNPLSLGGTTSGPLAVCAGQNTGTIALASYRGTILHWELSVDGGTTWNTIQNLNPELNFSNLAQTTQYRAVVKNGICGLAYSTVAIVTVNPQVIQANAGSDQVLCNETTFTLRGNDPATFTGGWTVVSGQTGVVFADDTKYNTSVSSLRPGEVYTFRWSINGEAPCPETSDEVSITILKDLTNNITSVSAVCSGQDVTITGDRPTGGDNQNYSFRWESSIDNTNWTPVNNVSGQNLTVNITITTFFRRVVVSGACTKTSASVQIIAQPMLANNIVSADQDICTGERPALLNGTIPTGGDGVYTYQWQKSEDAGVTWITILNASSQNYQSQAITKTTQFRRIISSTLCTGNKQHTSNAVTITVNFPPIAEFSFENNKGCLPFLIDADNIKAIDYADRNGEYTWYANNTEIGKGINFPGYTITTYGQEVEIKLIVTSKTNCKPGEKSYKFTTTQNVKPAFTFTPNKGCGPLTVRFTNTSSSLTDVKFLWDFGNGLTSNLANPNAVTFEPQRNGRDTLYTVTLKATTSNCGENLITQTILVRPKPLAIFSPDRTFGCSPFKVNFSNLSPGTGNTYTFDFGDGQTLITTDPDRVSHTFVTLELKTFKVKLTVKNECGSNFVEHDVKVSPNTIRPEILVNSIETAGCAPFLVEFRNNTTGANSFTYDFGDGSNVLKTNKAPENVSHTFTKPGVFTVRLSASNGCSDSVTTTKITVYPNPVVNFNADVRDGCTNLRVSFRDESANALSYLWYFGDGTLSTEKNPVHDFDYTQSPYSVKLIVTGRSGCTDTLSYKDYITVSSPPQADFSISPDTIIVIPDYTFSFTDRTTNSGDIVKWNWDFGDETKSTKQNATHSYTDTGSYRVKLMVLNKTGCSDTISKMVRIESLAGKLFVANAFMPGSGTPEFSVFKVKATGIKEWRMRVFNRWGQLLWESTELDGSGTPTEGWDGTMNGQPAPQGVYVWEISAQFVNGKEWKGMTYDNSSPKRTGVIHLIR